MNLIKNKLSININKYLNIFFNIITLNKLPLKGSLINFFIINRYDIIIDN